MRVLVQVAAHRIESNNGRTSIIDIINWVSASIFPLVIDEITFVLIFEIMSADYGRDVFIEMRARQADGPALVVTQESATLPTGEPGEPMHWRWTARLAPQEFPKAGLYAFEFFIDGELVAEIPIVARVRTA